MVESTTLVQMLQQLNILSTNYQGNLELQLFLTLPLLAVTYGLATLLTQTKDERDTIFILLLIQTIPFYPTLGMASWIISLIIVLLTITTLLKRWKTTK